MPGRSRATTSSQCSEQGAAPRPAVRVESSNLDALEEMISTHEIERTHEAEGDNGILQAILELSELERREFAAGGNVERLAEVVSSDVESYVDAASDEEACEQGQRVEELMTRSEVQDALEGQLAQTLETSVHVAIADRAATGRFPDPGAEVPLLHFAKLAVPMPVSLSSEEEAPSPAGTGDGTVVLQAVSTGASLETISGGVGLLGSIAGYEGRVSVSVDLHLHTPDGGYAFAQPVLAFAITANGLSLGDLSRPSVDVTFERLELDDAW